MSKFFAVVFSDPYKNTISWLLPLYPYFQII